MNPMQLLQIKNMWDQFTARHPKFPHFLSAVRNQGIQEGTIIEIQITSPDGRSYSSNLKVLPEDIELFNQIQSMK